MAFPDNLRSLGELRSRSRRARHGGQGGGVAFVFQGGGSLSAPPDLPAIRAAGAS